MFNLLTFIYQLLTLFVLVIVIWNMFETENKMEKALSALIIVPFVLRVLLVK